MAYDPCDPAEIDRIARLVSEGKYGEVEINKIDVKGETEPTDSATEVLRRERSGSYSSWRTVRAAMGDYFAATAHNDLTIAATRALNHTAKALEELNEGVRKIQGEGTFVGRAMERFFGIPVEKDIELYAALENMGSKGEWLTKEAASRFSPETKESAQSIRGLLERLYDNYIAKDPVLNKMIPDPATHLEGYFPHAKRAKDKGLFWNRTESDAAERAFINKLTAENIHFYHELERTGAMLDFEKRASIAVNGYIHSLMRAKFLKPEIQRIEKEVVEPMFNLRYYRDAQGKLGIVVNDPTGYMYWQEWKHNLLGGPTAGDVRQTANLKRLLGAYGYNTDMRTLYYGSNLISHVFYSGVMGAPIIGGRPASVMRQLGQLIPTFAELGDRHMLKGLKGAIDDIVVGTELARLNELGLITSHMDNLVSSLGGAQTVSRAVSVTANNFLKLFAGVDRFTRIATALGAESKFNEAFARGIETLKAGRDIKAEVIRRVKLGRVDEARNIYVKDVLSNTQYEYGKANRPEVFRGALGNVIGMMMSYPLNTGEMVRMLVKRGVQDNDWAPFARLLGASAIATYAGSELLDADIRSAFFFSALPHSITGIKIPADMWNAGVSTVEWGTGSLFNIGESKYARQKRHEYYNEGLKDLYAFIPGFGAWQDFNKMYAEGSFARALALTPKGARLDQLAKERRQQRALEEGRGGGGGLGMSSMKGF